jgi:hypothetical protein
MNDDREPLRLREEAALREIFESASVDEDAATVARLGERLGVASLAAGQGPEAQASGSGAADSGAAGSGSAGSGAAGSGAAATGASSMAALVVLVTVVIAILALRGALEQPERGPEPLSALAEPAPAPPAVQRAGAEEPRTASSITAAESSSQVPSATAGEPGDGSNVLVRAPDATVRASDAPVRASDARAPRRAAVAAPHAAAARPEAAVGDGPMLSGDLAAEVRLIQQMRAAAQADPPLALRLAEQHRAEFPSGRLVHERERLEARARGSAAR